MDKFMKYDLLMHKISEMVRDVMLDENNSEDDINLLHLQFYQREKDINEMITNLYLKQADTVRHFKTKELEKMFYSIEQSMNILTAYTQMSLLHDINENMTMDDVIKSIIAKTAKECSERFVLEQFQFSVSPFYESSLFKNTYANHKENYIITVLVSDASGNCKKIIDYMHQRNFSHLRTYRDNLSSVIGHEYLGNTDVCYLYFMYNENNSFSNRKNIEGSVFFICLKDEANDLIERGIPFSVDSVEYGLKIPNRVQMISSEQEAINQYYELLEKDEYSKDDLCILNLDITKLPESYVSHPIHRGGIYFNPNDNEERLLIKNAFVEMVNIDE